MEKLTSEAATDALVGLAAVGVLILLFAWLFIRKHPGVLGDLVNWGVKFEKRMSQGALQFADDSDPVTFTFDTESTRNTFAVDSESRTISGIAVPYGVPARKGGHNYQFSKGSLSWDPRLSRTKMLIQHTWSLAVGRAIELDDRPEGLFARFKIARTPEGDRALALAEDGVYDGLSIGAGEKFSQRDGVWHSQPGNALTEISLVPNPAFDGARVSAVVAEADTGRNTSMTPEEIQALIDAALGAHDAAKPAAPAVTLEANQGPEVIDPNGGATTFEVNEPAPYVFDRRGILHAGAFDFSTDLFTGLQNRDQVRLDRVIEFMGHQFDVDTADVNEVNPAGQRPDLYVNQKKFTYPLWEAVRKGTITDNTPFIIPKWASSTGLVAAHVEGTEPTPGTFVTTGQTITPGAVSGKVEITREVFDAGGNPNVSNLIWDKMVTAYYEGIEAAIQAMLVAATASITDIALTAGGGTTGQTLAAELGAAVAGLQFVRGGFSFDTFVAQIDLYKALAGAQDDTGRPLFPILGPVNANGQARKAYQTIDVYGLEGIPGTFLEPTGSDEEESWIFDSKDIFSVASAPQRLEFQSLVKQVELGIWGYTANAVTDATGVREVKYDPVA